MEDMIMEPIEQCSIQLELNDVISNESSFDRARSDGIKEEPMDREYGSYQSPELNPLSNDLDPHKSECLTINIEANETLEGDLHNGVIKEEFHDTIKSEAEQIIMTVNLDCNAMESGEIVHEMCDVESGFMNGFEILQTTKAGFGVPKVEDGYSLLRIEHTPLSISQALSHPPEQPSYIKSENSHLINVPSLVVGEVFTKSEMNVDVESISNEGAEIVRSRNRHISSHIRRETNSHSDGLLSLQGRICPSNCVGCDAQHKQQHLSKPKKSHRATKNCLQKPHNNKPKYRLSKKYIDSWREQLSKEIKSLNMKQFYERRKRIERQRQKTTFENENAGYHHPSACYVELRNIFDPRQEGDLPSTLMVPKSRNPFQCLLCTFSTWTVGQFYQHLHLKHRLDNISSGAIYPCPQCLLLFTNQLDFSRHLWQTNHLPDEKVVESLTCDHVLTIDPVVYCNQRFVHNYLLLKHQSEEHNMFDSDSYYCTQCPALYNVKKFSKEAQRHRQAHLKVFSCPACSYVRVGPSPLQLLYHISRHISPSEDRIQRCVHCRGIFFTKSSYNAHMEEDSCPAKVRLVLHIYPSSIGNQVIPWMIFFR